MEKQTAWARHALSLPLQDRALGRKARGSRVQLCAMITPRHASVEAQDVVRALLDQAAVP